MLKNPQSLTLARIKKCLVKHDTDKLTYETEMNSQHRDRLVAAKGEKGREGQDWEFAIIWCKLL